MKKTSTARAARIVELSLLESLFELASDTLLETLASKNPALKILKHRRIKSCGRKIARRLTKIIV